MPDDQADRTPQPGERLILSDGRVFVMHHVELGVRGWWFTATAQDGDSTLQGNLQLEWDSQASAWRPRGAGGGRAGRQRKASPARSPHRSQQETPRQLD